MRKINNVLSISMLAAMHLMSCSEDEKAIQFVDLRYNALDKYELVATSPDEISFEVKSNLPWSVTSKMAEWVEITPANGPGGEDVVPVTVQYLDNVELDDRLDTITIQSDYWVGKKIAVFQKGTAYLNFTANSELVSKGGGDYAIQIESNQKWSVNVDTLSQMWVAATSATEGENNGAVSLAISANAGEQRTAKVYLKDRHGVVQQTVVVKQEGTILNPVRNEIRVLDNITSYKLHVESDAQWVVEKDDVSIDWYDFVSTSFDQSGELEITLKPNSSTVAPARSATFTLSTVAQEGAIPVKKVVTLRQAYKAESEKVEFDQVYRTWDGPIGADKNVAVNGTDATFTGLSRMLKGNNMPGRYDFYIASMNGGAHPTLVLSYNDNTNKMLQFDLNASSGKTDVKALKGPGSVAENVIAPKVQADFDYNARTKISVELIESETDPGYTHVRWLLNDVLVFELESTSWMESGKWGEKFQSMYVGTRAGQATFDFYEYTAPIQWK